MRTAVAFVFLAALALANAAAVKDETITPAEFTPVLRIPDSPISTHIISGSAAGPSMFPWQAALLLTKSGGQYICGGIVVHANWILTAGHCTKGATSILVRLGSLDYNAGGTTYSVSGKTNIITNKNYNAQSLVNDVGLIRIPSITPSASISTIKVLPTSVTSFPGNLTVSGWGKTCDANTATCYPGKFLNYVNLLHLSLPECQAVYGRTTVTDSVICTKSFNTGNENICGGDSGGPLVQLGTTNYLVGVVSFGAAAGCELGMPSGYSYANRFCDWMKTTSGVTICVP